MSADKTCNEGFTLCRGAKNMRIEATGRGLARSSLRDRYSEEMTTRSSRRSWRAGLCVSTGGGGHASAAQHIDAILLTLNYEIWPI